eukprot:gene29867-6593_t
MPQHPGICLVEGAKYHLQGVKSGQNVAIKPDGEVHGHGKTGKHATWTVENARGHIQLKNADGAYLAIKGG